MEWREREIAEDVDGGVGVGVGDGDDDGDGGVEDAASVLLVVVGCAESEEGRDRTELLSTCLPRSRDDNY